MIKKILLIAILLFAFNSILVTADTILVNSQDWKDVYSGMQYGYLTGTTPKFLVSNKHATLILPEIGKAENLEVYSSKKKPWMVGYGSLLESQGYVNADETIFNSLSIELATKLNNIKNYIIVDDSYGYNALAIAPYAIKSSSYVLFADRKNIREVTKFLNTVDVEHIIIYGHVDRIVKERLEEYDPETINYDGDRFENNVAIVKKYKEIQDAKQVLLTNGEFIEAEIMAGNYPALFIGVQNVPQKIKDYIQNSNIEVGVLIGNELVGSATAVRRQTGISTFVKFARSARNPSGPVSKVEGLDIFRVPKYDLNLIVQSMRYNAATRQLEVTIENLAEVASYFRGTYTLSSGEQVQTVGDLDPVFIDSNDVKTIVDYEIDPFIGEDSITAKVFLIFGESKNSLERAIEMTIEVERVSIRDDTDIEIQKIVYHKSGEKFIIYIKNIGELDAYVDTEMIDLDVLDLAQTDFSADEIIKISTGKVKKSIIHVEMTEEDLEVNEQVRVRAYYGERENSLVKIKEGMFNISIKAVDIWTFLPIVIIILLILLIMKKKKKKHHGGPRKSILDGIIKKFKKKHH